MIIIWSARFQHRRNDEQIQAYKHNSTNAFKTQTTPTSTCR